MCGIAGMYLYKHNDLQQPYFSWCLTTMRHRGPDAQQTWDNGANYITAFSRLAIRDTSASGNQPMLSDCKNYCITFNGEIYNTDVLLYHLKPYRQYYKSTSDTELLLYALMHLGARATLELIDGIFSFAFYNNIENKLILARDRMGIKPLYVGECNEGIVYSSQYDHIINHPFFKNNTTDHSVIATYLHLGYMPENAGLVRNTRSLPHGFYTVVENSTATDHCYYSYGINKTNDAAADDKILDDAVASQLISDVPVGTFMSGGVDSTLVSYYARQHENLQSFTIGVAENEMDESAAAKAFADKFGIRNSCRFIITNDMQNLLKENALAFTEPFADISSLPLLLLSKFAKEKVTVALSGDGGDELFWGYARNIHALQNIKYYTGTTTARRISLLFHKLSNPSATHVSRHWRFKNFVDYYYSSLSIPGALHWLPQVCKAKPHKPFFLEEAYKIFLTAASKTDVMNVARKMEMDIHLQRILIKVDRASMYHSLEVRVPFLSNGMLQHSLNYDYTNCIEGNTGKINLKKSLAHKAGEALVMKPKKGFIIPIDAWLRGDLKNVVTEKIMDMPAHLANIFNRQKLQLLLNGHMQRKHNAGWFIWALFNLAAWQETHCNKK